MVSVIPGGLDGGRPAKQCRRPRELPKYRIAETTLGIHFPLGGGVECRNSKSLERGCTENRVCRLKHTQDLDDAQEGGEVLSSALKKSRSQGSDHAGKVKTADRVRE